MTDQPSNLVQALSDEIVRVSLKAERWRQMIRTFPEYAPGMRPGLALMEAEIKRARDTLGSSDPVPIMAALEALRDYDNND